MTNAQGNRGWAAVMVGEILMILAAASAAPAQTFKMLHSFDNADGANPLAALVQATDGNLYGTTPNAGANGFGGTIFKITPGGALTTLYSFCSQSSCTDGAGPDLDGLVQAIDGNFYGTTQGGGETNNGSVFKITPAGVLTTLYSFCAQIGCADGRNPYSGLAQGRDGNFYGTTSNGGANQDSGTVFKITPNGTLTTLYSFCAQNGCTDGKFPEAALIQASDGDFYGTTKWGTNGTVFRISPSGVLTTLYNFCPQGGACTDGQNPVAVLVEGTDGNFYGTTYYGGADSGGTVFKITPQGTLTTVYSFCSQVGCTDGKNPQAGLMQGSDGNLYGTTRSGGSNVNDIVCPDGCGTVFKIIPGGAMTTVYSFCSRNACPDGAIPFAALVQATNGTLYGTASNGGTNDVCADATCGTVFSLAVGLGPFVETQPTFGKVGKVIKILGTSLTGATGVTFNGTAATFKVISPSLIGATIPTGATTGPVQVVTPSGTLTSNVNFRVEP